MERGGGDAAVGEQGGAAEGHQMPAPHTPQPPVSEARRAGAEAADEHMGPSSEGDTAPEATLAEAGGTEHAQFHSHIPTGFSLVVNDVDAEKANTAIPGAAIGSRSAEESGDDRSHESAAESEADAGGGGEEEACRTHGTLTHSSSQKELSDARIKQIQGEVESRKNEFARLLEEHAQVVKQLKAMEEEDGAEGRVGRSQLH